MRRVVVALVSSIALAAQAAPPTGAVTAPAELPRLRAQPTLAAIGEPAEPSHDSSPWGRVSTNSLRTGLIILGVVAGVGSVIALAVGAAAD